METESEGSTIVSHLNEIMYYDDVCVYLFLCEVLLTNDLDTS